MKNRIKKYVDNLFSEIYETKQLIKLKEEISANLLEKINDFIAKGDSVENAFSKAVTNLGDMSELVGSLEKASQTKRTEDSLKPIPIDKEHIRGYMIASVIVLIGLMIGGMVYLQHNDLSNALTYLVPFILIAAPIFIYFGLTQESMHDYGMNNKRALTYSVASEIFLIGAAISGIEYFQEQSINAILFKLIPFVVVSAIIFIYLGLTEKSRSKMGPDWEKQWVDYYSNPQTAAVRGGISGALWIFSIAAFIILGFVWSWKFSWIVLVVAAGCEPLIEAYFASKRKSVR